MRVVPKAAVIILLAAGPMNQLNFASAQSRPEAAMFNPDHVVEGIRTSKEDCAPYEAQDTAVFVTAAGTSACIRYYASGLKNDRTANPVTMVWLNGDVLGPSGKNADKRQSGFGPAEMVALEAQVSRRFGIPAVYLARPGTYGSSGKHYTMRGRPIEAALVDAALDALKQRYAIEKISLGGHSGGGTLVAELLSRRTDLNCAVISSGASAYRAYLEARNLIKPGDPVSRFDPYASLDKIRIDPKRRVFVVGDPRETNVPFSAQKLFFEGLVARGHAAWLIPLERARDDRHHDLVDFGEAATGLCAAGETSEHIVQTLNSLPEPPPRLSN